MTDDRRPEAERPSIDHRPSATAHRPSIAHRPKAIAHPSAIDHRPSPIGDRPSAKPSSYEDKKKADAEARRAKKEADVRQRRIAELEARIATAEQAIKELEAAMSEPGFYEDRHVSKPIIDRHQALMWEVGDLMNQWEALQAQPKV